jgi:hypothetical protein
VDKKCQVGGESVLEVGGGLANYLFTYVARMIALLSQPCWAAVQNSMDNRALSIVKLN